MKGTFKPIFTLVRHSAWSVKQDPQFEHAVEESMIDSRLITSILKAGGLIFTSYAEASDRAEMENYPNNHEGHWLIPRVRGTFKIVGRKEPIDVYIPM